MKTEGAATAEEGGGGGGVERLPEDCLSRILSFTSPRDVCRSSAVSAAFLAATASDLVWNRFLPPDYECLLSRSSSPVIAPSRRELYFRLCGSIPIDDGSKIVWLEKATGKKCYMLSARALGITWGDDRRYWRWISVPDHARFPEVAELLSVCWLDIRASISCGDLSPGTRYGAYLVMRLSDSPYGLEEPPQETAISVGGVPSSTHRVRLQERRPQHIYHQQQEVLFNNLFQFAVDETRVTSRWRMGRFGRMWPEEDFLLQEGADDDVGEEEDDDEGEGEGEISLLREEAGDVREEEEEQGEGGVLQVPDLEEGPTVDGGSPNEALGTENHSDDMLTWVPGERGYGWMEMRLNGTQSMISQQLPEEEEEEEGEIWLLPEEAGDVLPGEGVLPLPDLEEGPTVDGGSPSTENHSDDGSGISETSSPDHDQQEGQPPPDMMIWVPGERGDGWMELDMGDFFVEVGADEELVEMRLNGTQSMHWKSGLVVHGIEVRALP